MFILFVVAMQTAFLLEPILYYEKREETVKHQNQNDTRVRDSKQASKEHQQQQKKHSRQTRVFVLHVCDS